MKNKRFFQAGGTLNPDIPSYIERKADEKLLHHLLSGDYCYILTPRQMGKSSLMARTAKKLKEKDILTAIVDLTQVGTDDVKRERTGERWYYRVIIAIARELTITIDINAWWNSCTGLSSVQKFIAFFKDILLKEKPDQKIVIFIDEIDTTLSLPFTDDFFAAIRSLYNLRADKAEAKLWDTQTQEPIGSPMSLNGDVASAAFSPDGKKIFIGSNDNTARLWDVDTQKPIGLPMPHHGQVDSVAFSPDGKKLIVAGRPWLFVYDVNFFYIPVKIYFLSYEWTGGYKFEDKSGNIMKAAFYAMDRNSVFIKTINFDLSDIEPVTGDPDELLEEWQKRLALRFNENGEIVPDEQL